MGYKRIKNNAGTKILMVAVLVNKQNKNTCKSKYEITMANLNWYMAKHNVTRNDYKNCIFKKREQGSKVKKLCTQVRDQIVTKEIEDTAQGLLQNGNKF